MQTVAPGCRTTPRQVSEEPAVGFCREVLLAARKLRFVTRCTTGHALGGADQPGLAAVRAAPVAHRTFVVGEIERERVVLRDSTHLGGPCVVPADEVDGVAEVVAIRAARARRLAVVAPRRFERLRIALRVGRPRSRDETEKFAARRARV